ncbi:DUF2062 domain-containing protein [Paenibacillus hamazuiensis]|uniref:DUF2062 domain-containing protein n=1 Tax=Paenibacillus hamazuiensis TaxID=2936508 RepID=UPI00200C1843|nr:DUF2062 domain-containing protein [Paenibacillus hamazuiensis]
MQRIEGKFSGLMQSVRRINVRNTKRYLRFKYLMLLRAKGGSSKVARGFAIGLAIEMFTPPTIYLATFLLFPFTYLFRASMAGAIVGFVLGKIIYIPFLFPIRKVGGLILPRQHYRHVLDMMPDWLGMFLQGGLKLIVGGMVVGAVLGLLSYFPIKWLLDFYEAKRKDKRKRRKAQLMLSSESET